MPQRNAIYHYILYISSLTFGPAQIWLWQKCPSFSEILPNARFSLIRVPFPSRPSLVPNLTHPVISVLLSLYLDKLELL